MALPEVEITTCLRRGEIEIDVRYRDEAAATAEAVRAGLAERHPRAALQRGRARRSTPRSRSCSPAIASASPSRAAAGCWRRGSPTCPAPPPTWPARVVAYSNEAKVELLGVDEALIERHGAVSPEVAEAMAIGAIERFGGRRRGLDHRHRRPGRRQRGEAGRLRLLQRTPRRRHRDRPRAGDPRRPRRHPRALGAGRACTCCACSSAAPSLLCRDSGYGFLADSRCPVRPAAVAWGHGEGATEEPAGEAVRGTRPAGAR